MRAAQSTFWKILGEKWKPKCASTSSTSLTSTHSYNSCTDLWKKTKLFFTLTMQKTGSANMQKRCSKSILEHPTGKLHCTMMLCTPQIVHRHSVPCHLPWSMIHLPFGLSLNQFFSSWRRTILGSKSSSSSAMGRSCNIEERRTSISWAPFLSRWYLPL